MEDGLWHGYVYDKDEKLLVLILILMEDGLWQLNDSGITKLSLGLNPYSNGRWSLTCW